MSEMTDNERLMMNLVTAIQKGLQTGRLDISDMAYLQAHLDNEIDRQIRERAEELGEGYNVSLNNYVSQQRQAMSGQIDYQQRRIDKLERELERAEKKLKGVELPKWLVLTKTGITTVGSIAATVITFLLTIKSVEFVYDWLWSLQMWHWFTYAMIVVATLLFFYVLFWVYVGFISTFTELLKDNQGFGRKR